MLYNFLKPRETFENALSSETMTDAWMIALLTGIIFGIATWLSSGSTYPAIGVSILFVVEWFILAGIIYVLEFMMKNKKKRIADKSFVEIASAVGKLWIIVLIIGIILVGIIVINNALLSTILIALIAIFSLIFIYNLFVLIKVTMEAKNLRSIVTLIITLVLHGLLTNIALIVLGTIL